MKDQGELNRLALIVSWVVLLVAGGLGVAPLVPPAPPVGLNNSEFSVARAFDHIERIASEPRPIGSAANQRVRADIIAQLRSMGLEPEVQSIEVPNYYSGSAESVEISNVVAIIPGTEPTMAVALVGHYDTVPGTPGANDDASAVAIMLETARAILAGQPLRNDVILVFTDGEEPAPRFGSTAFVSGHPWAGDIGFIINLEALGSGGSSAMTGMSGPGGQIIDWYIEAVQYPAAFSFLSTTADLIGGSNTDFEPFQTAGIAGVEFAYLRGSPIYHTMADTSEHVSLRSLYQQGANTLSLTRYIGDLELGPSTDESSAVFFSVGRFYTVRYPVTWALPIALLAGMVLLIAVWRQGEWLGVIRSVGATFAMMIVSVVVTVGVWTWLVGQRGTMDVAESYLYLAAMLVLITVIGIIMARLVKRRIGQLPDAAGVVTIWWLLGLLTAILAPGMSYLFVLSALAGGLALLWRSLSSADNPRQLVFSTVVISTAFVTLIPAVDAFYQFAQPRPGNPDSEILSIIAIPVILLVLVVELFRVFWLRPILSPTPESRMATLKE